MTLLGSLHHIELRTANLITAKQSWGWLLAQLGYQPYQQWNDGCSWRNGATYIVLDQISFGKEYDRRGPGLNHLAFHAGTPANLDRLWAEAPHHGWTRLYEDRHPRAGSPDQYHGFLENSERFKVELVAGPVSAS